MAAAPVQSFNVVFGINETPLTQALETRRFDDALAYINSRHGMCLDEGLYQRIPLYIVLSGENSTVDGEAIPIHLKIARRLIERVLWIRTSWSRKFTPSMCYKLLQPSDKQRHCNIRKNTEVT